MKKYSIIYIILLLSACGGSKNFVEKERESWIRAKMSAERKEYSYTHTGETTVTTITDKADTKPVTKKEEPSESKTNQQPNAVLSVKQSLKDSLSEERERDKQLEKYYKKPIKPNLRKIGVEALLSEKEWDKIFPNRFGLKDKSDFFSYETFVQAAQKFPHFLNEGTVEDRQRELAAFLAHISQETGELRYREQLTVKHNYAVQHKDYPPVEGKDYHGRGPIQLSYNYNYGQFSKDYFGDKLVLLQDPDRLTNDAVISFASAIWFWMTPQSPKPSCHQAIIGTFVPSANDISAKRLPGFGLTLNIINAPQCGCSPSEHVQNRYNYYAQYCRMFGIPMGENATCTRQTPYGKK